MVEVFNGLFLILTKRLLDVTIAKFGEWMPASEVRTKYKLVTGKTKKTQKTQLFRGLGIKMFFFLI